MKTWLDYFKSEGRWLSAPHQRRAAFLHAAEGQAEKACLTKRHRAQNSRKRGHLSKAGLSTSAASVRSPRLVPRPVPSLDARMFTTFRGGQAGGLADHGRFSPVKGRCAATGDSDLDHQRCCDRVGRCWHRKRRGGWRGVASHLRYAERAREGKTRGSAGRAQPRRGHLRGADPDPEIIRLVGT